MNEFMINLSLIKPEIRYTALKQYMIQCDMKHSIGFYQWRFLHHPKKCNAKEHCDLLRENIKALSDHLVSKIDISRKTSEET